MKKEKTLEKSLQPQKNNRYEKWIGAFAIITIPLYTLAFGFSESPFQYTLSMMGNYFDWDHRLNFITWGIITGALFVFYISWLFTKTGFKNPRAKRWLRLSNSFLVLTVLTPSIKGVFPICTQLHLLFTILFALSLVLSMLFFVTYLSEINQNITHKSLKWALIIVGGSLLSLFIFGKTGIFEIFFFVSFSIYLIVLGLWLQKIDQCKTKLKSAQLQEQRIVMRVNGS
jgi:hypothetical protein